MQGDTDEIPPVIAWLDAFAAAVRAGDFAAGRGLFADDVVAFGTVERVCRGIDTLERGQWRDVWPRTRDYRVQFIDGAAQDGLAWAGVTWASVARSDGRLRSGRATFVLRRIDGAWRAVHSHHSFDPDSEQRR